MSLRRLGSAVTKEFRQFVRDPVLLILVLWLYTAEVVICAVALTFDLNDEPTGVVDLDRSRASRSLSNRFDRSASFAVRPVGTEREARTMLDAGDLRMVVVIPRGFEETLRRGGGDHVQLLIDGTNSMTGRTALGQARGILLRASREEAARTLADAATASVGPSVDNRIRVLYNPGLRFAHFVVISMLALAAYMVGVIHPAASIVKEKESGTAEQLAVTPLGPGELLIAKTLPTFVVGLAAFGPGLLVARAFGVPFGGDPLTFTVVSSVFMLGAVGTGVLVASLVRTLQQALLVSFFVLFPVLFLSGTMIPIETMPPVVEALTRLSPLRYYVEALTGIFLKDLGLSVLWPQVLWLGTLGVGILGVGALQLRRRRV
ncbi:MAG: ABC transporter permease [Gemmatimonadetes bacterium]|nr:ABC transporter permease [Gemmatimonadota bacterium]NIR78912.1 ABC transporter permease [Gemmatimonadota bacterium]NIT87547.1 ABC transporter permease [Gemmatimonadota bacterium]NIU31415.1 ABC transporter permease [Gemmatimonadota bacterium]NIU36100.1 ABC transporter permease [Gemmatimonadota bacterium]